MSEQNLAYTLQDIPQIKQAFMDCAQCDVLYKLDEHKGFVKYLTERAKEKALGPYLAKNNVCPGDVYIPNLIEIIENYAEQLEKGKPIPYRTDEGVSEIDLGKEYRTLKGKVGDNAITYLAWSIAKFWQERIHL